MTKLTIHLLQDHDPESTPLPLEGVRAALHGVLPNLDTEIIDNVTGFSAEERAALLAQARENAAPGAHVDTDAAMLHTSGGAYVCHWVWVPYGEVELVGGPDAFEGRMAAAGLSPEVWTHDEDGSGSGAAVVVAARCGSGVLIARSPDPTDEDNWNVGLSSEPELLGAWERGSADLETRLWQAPLSPPLPVREACALTVQLLDQR